MLDRFILHCPQCGKVEGYWPSDLDEDQTPGSGDQEIEEQVFESVHGPVTKVRCPNCGQWLETTREQPPD
jgi:predicted RNA-binding Zn-ribbon protein involved in translation (DUF1610 family)